MKFAPLSTATLALLALGISACTAGSDPGASPSAGETFDPRTMPDPAEPVLQVEATATAENGAVLELSLEVDSALRIDDPAADELVGLLTDTCDPGFIDEQRLEDERWGLVAMHVSAEATGSAQWPEDAVISLASVPESERGRAAIAGAGTSLLPPEELAEAGICSVPARINGAGDALVAFALSGDFAETAPTDVQGTLWNRYAWGFESVNQAEPSPVTLSGCDVARTAAGEELRAPEFPFDTFESDTECFAGHPR